MPVRYNPAELQALEHLDEHPVVVEELQRVGEEIADRARALCPKDTGELAASIHAELSRDPVAGLQVRVSWDRSVFYGWMVEGGTTGGQGNGTGTPPRPFLRPAAAPYQDSELSRDDI